ncbi:MAG: hypothetical protein ACI8Y7_001120, partial [Candidatus Woesearchaeota archaeon]
SGNEGIFNIQPLQTIPVTDQASRFIRSKELKPTAIVTATHVCKLGFSNTANTTIVGQVYLEQGTVQPGTPLIHYDALQIRLNKSLKYANGSKSSVHSQEPFDMKYVVFDSQEIEPTLLYHRHRAGIRSIVGRLIGEKLAGCVPNFIHFGHKITKTNPYSPLGVEDIIRKGVLENNELHWVHPDKATLKNASRGVIIPKRPSS